MDKRPIEIKPNPVGTVLVRLREIPITRRLAAARECVRDAKDAREASQLLRLALHPGDAGGRIAA